MKLVAITALCTLVSVVEGFGVPVRLMQSSSTRLLSVKTSFDSDKLERAVKCAENFELCDVEELDRLADELESYDGSLEGSLNDGATPATRAKEAADKNDIVDILRMERELKNRHEYLKKANLFADNVHEKHNQEERDDFLEHMDETMDL